MNGIWADLDLGLVDIDGQVGDDNLDSQAGAPCISWSGGRSSSGGLAFGSNSWHSTFTEELCFGRIWVGTTRTTAVSTTVVVLLLVSNDLEKKQEGGGGFVNNVFYIGLVARESRTESRDLSRTMEDMLDGRAFAGKRGRLFALSCCCGV